MTQEELFKNLIAHAKEYGFIFQSSEIYDGLSAVYDYGQLGAELKNNQHNAIRGALAQAARMKTDTTIRLDRAIYNNLGADEFKRLINDRTFGYIYEELQQINKTIIDYFKTHNITTDYVTYSPINPKTGKKEPLPGLTRRRQAERELFLRDGFPP